MPSALLFSNQKLLINIIWNNEKIKKLELELYEKSIYEIKSIIRNKKIYIYIFSYLILILLHLCSGKEKKFFFFLESHYLILLVL